MSDRIIADFAAKGTRLLLVAHDEGRDGYTVFMRVINNLNLDDVRCYNKKVHAIARFLFLTNRILLEIW